MLRDQASSGCRFLAEYADQIVPKFNLGASLLHHRRLLDDRQKIAPAPIDDKPRGKTAEHEGEDNRHPGEGLLFYRVGRLWGHLHLNEHGDAHDERPNTDGKIGAEYWNRRRIIRDEAEQIEDIGWVGAREILDPAKERRLPHLNRNDEHLIEREKYRNLYKQRQATRQGIDLFALVKRHGFHLLLLFVVGKAVADRHDLRLHVLHLGHRHIAAIGERKKDSLDKNGNNQDRDAKIANKIVNEVKQPEHRLGNKIKPAPVDQEIEFLDT